MNNVIEAIKSADSIAIFPHLMADGDAIGSCLALQKLLNDYGKTADIIFEEQISYKYQFMLHENSLMYIYPKISNKRYDLHVSLDSGDLQMLSKRAQLYKSCKTVNIDHHKTNTLYGNINFVSSEAAATGEIIYNFIKLWDSSYIMDKYIAKCLYVAISTDTGGFRFNNTTKATHDIAGDLVDKGIDVEDISKKVFELMPKPQMNLLQIVLPNISFVFNNRIGIIKINAIDYEKAGANEEHSDGFVNYVRNVEGVDVAVSLREKSENEIKVSLRSSKVVDVSEVAKSFGGGGHENAAGCTIYANMKQAESQIVEYLIGRIESER